MMKKCVDSIRIENMRVTLSYTAGYLSIGLEPVRLRAYIVQAFMGRREVVVI
jgi:hypothetical protein